jgi:hypothetical protein
MARVRASGWLDSTLMGPQIHVEYENVGAFENGQT